MRVKALITGLERIHGPAKGEKAAFDFTKLNFIDTENEAGTAQSASLPKDPGELAVALHTLEALRMKPALIHIFQSGNYLNFGGLVQEGAK